MTSDTQDRQSSHGLRPLRHVYTANDMLSRKAIFTQSRPGTQTTYSEGKMAVDTIYGASPIDQLPNFNETDDTTPAACSALGAGSSRPGGTVCRVVDFAPLYECAMQRGQNLDYAVVVEGSIVLTLDSGQETMLERGDVAVQRAATHSWRNPSETEWARVFFVLQDCASAKPGNTRWT
ncbi:hypothetical protein HIM_08369 [Hirsutella minnesotensis 3608]|uniref:Cupin 2 conserved barrel domain-containing protein n=1 Tax=Hirsutella minnesotensis 3608 TaxID=1043627 RepID=A0A0F7ZYC4_9HYPO|nr:hypothetical protein HIM_08369 [Hirsutella minnesotensis 3608]